LRANAIAGPWAAGERILVCLSEDPRAAGLVRYTSGWRPAARALDGDLDRDPAQPAADRRTARPARRHHAARRSLGAEALTIPGVGRRIADDVIHFAQANNVTQIIIGKSTRSWWFELMRGSVVHDLVRRAGNISVNVIAGDEQGVTKAAVQTAAPAEPFNPRPYLMALLFVTIGLAAASLIEPLFGGIENVDLVFLRRWSALPRAMAWAVAAGERRGVAVL